MSAFSSMVCVPVFLFSLFTFWTPSSSSLVAEADEPVVDAAHQESKPAWKSQVNIPISAYSSEVGQTDSTPFITASGSRVRDGVVAANFLPIGTKVRIPQLYGDKEFVVEDRMNARYHKKMDIWMEDVADARRFGLKHALVEIY